jgi:hypothetical protein
VLRRPNRKGVAAATPYQPERRQARHSCSSQNQTRFQAPSGGRAQAPEYAAPTGLGNWVARVSNPCFELWLFLHLQNNRHFVDRHHCQRELGKICKSYRSNGKSGYDAKSLMAAITKAIQRAKVLDVHPKDFWPKNQATRVYILVEKLLIGISSKANQP